MLRRLGGNARVWMLNVAIAIAAGAAGFALRNTAQHDDTVTLTWWMLAPLFFLTEIFVINIPFRREAQSFSLSEIPLVLGLFFATPTDLVIGQVLGAGIALIAHRRQPVVKWSFNIAHLALEAALASVLFHLVAAPARVLIPEEIAGTFGATALSIVLGVMAVVSAITLAEGRPAGAVFVRVLSFGLIGAATNTSIALMTVVFLRLEPAAVWLMAVPIVTLFVAYRGYSSYRAQLVTMQKLYESTRRMQESRWIEPAVKSLLESAKEIFHSERASLLLLPTANRDAAVEYTVDDAGDLHSVTSLAPDAHTREASHIASESKALLLARPIEDPAMKDHYSARGIRDAIVAPFFGDAGTIGTLTVANKLSDIETYTSEDLTLLETLANHASVAFENAKLVTEQKESIGGLQELHRLKDEFLATVSHELRTPLMSITGYIDLMKHDRGLTAEERARGLEVMHRQSIHLRALIEDILMSARLESTGVRVRPTTVAVDSVIRRVGESFASWNPGSRIELQLDAKLPLIETDEDAVRRIVSNLVHNALKHSPETTTVTVGAKEESGGVRVWVEDRGTGIPRSMHDRIFDRFVQVEGSPGKRASGTGLGLSICRGLADSLGGEVTLERSAPGLGSVFSVWLPSRAPADVIDMTRRIPIDRATAERL